MFGFYSQISNVYEQVKDNKEIYVELQCETAKHK